VPTSAAAAAAAAVGIAQANSLNPAGFALSPPSASLLPPPPIALPPLPPTPESSVNSWRTAGGASSGAGEAAGWTGPAVGVAGAIQQQQELLLLQEEQQQIVVGAQFVTSKDLRVAVEKSLMVNGRGLVCKRVSK